MSGVRFTAWFSEEERERIANVADQLHCSDNFVVRSAVRVALGLDEGAPLSQLSQVTNGGDEQNVPTVRA